MLNQSSRNVAPRPTYMDASGTELIQGFGTLALAGLGIALLVSGYPTILLLLTGLWNVSWSTMGTDIVANVIFGAIGGLVIGWLRVHRKSHQEVVNELVSATASPDFVSAARINATAIALHVGSGMCAGLLVGALGVAAPSDWGTHVLTHAGPLMLAFGGAGAGGGGPSASGWELLSFLFAFILIACILTILGSIVVHGLLAAAARSAVIGAAQGWGQSLGTSFTLAVTRLWTSRLTWQATEARQAPPLTLDEAINDYAGTCDHTRNLIGNYIEWLRETGYPRTIESAAEHFYDWASVLERRGKGRPPKAVSLFHLHVDQEVRKRHPTEWFAEPPGVPQYDGNPTTLFYHGWFRRALRSGAFTGAASAILQTGIVSLFMVWLK